MARSAKPNDFLIQLPDIGDFVFGRRTIGDHARIRAEYLRYVRGVDDDDELGAYATLLAIMKVLCVSAPKEWRDIENITMDDGKINNAFDLLRLFNEAEESFRNGAIQGSETPGQGLSE